MRVLREDQWSRQAPARTLLEQIVRGSRRTIEENCVAFEKTARAHGESATLSSRQLSRWMAGEVGIARPVCQRVAQWHWGHSFEQLVGQPAAEDGNGQVRQLVSQERVEVHAAIQAVEAGPAFAAASCGDGATVQLMIPPGAAVVVLPADHPVLAVLAAGGVGAEPVGASPPRHALTRSNTAGQNGVGRVADR